MCVCDNDGFGQACSTEPSLTGRHRALESPCSMSFCEAWFCHRYFFLGGHSSVLLATSMAKRIGGRRQVRAGKMADGSVPTGGTSGWSIPWNWLEMHQKSCFRGKHLHKNRISGMSRPSIVEARRPLSNNIALTPFYMIILLHNRFVPPFPCIQTPHPRRPRLAPPLVPELPICVCVCAVPGSSAPVCLPFCASGVRVAPNMTELFDVDDFLLARRAVLRCRRASYGRCYARLRVVIRPHLVRLALSPSRLGSVVRLAFPSSCCLLVPIEIIL